MGTPEFAVPCLDKLHKAGYNIAAVITAPDRPAGRGLKLTKSAVKIYALEKGFPILQPEKLKNPEFIKTLESYQAQVQVVVAFRMLPEIVWNMPPLGTINVHGSLLPQYRGAAPINWAIINGETETGVTTFKLQHAIDTGNILMQEIIPIDPQDTAGTLHDKMKEIGAGLLVKTLQNIERGNLTEISQQAGTLEAGLLKHAPKIYTETCLINWDNSVESIHNLIRGLSPQPTAFTFLGNKKLKIYAAEILPASDQMEAHVTGEMLSDNKTFIKFKAANGYLSLQELQLEGKKKMRIDEFLRGWRA